MKLRNVDPRAFNEWLSQPITRALVATLHEAYSAEARELIAQVAKGGSPLAIAGKLERTQEFLAMLDQVATPTLLGDDDDNAPDPATQANQHTTWSGAI